MIYRINFKSQLYHFWPIFIFLAIDILFVFYTTSRFGRQDLIIYILIALGMFLIFFLPTIYIHIEYYLKNRDAELRIDYQNKYVEYKQKENTTSFRFKEIKWAEQNKTPAMVENRILKMLPWDTYNYSKIILNDGKELYITCLLVNELKLPIDPSKIKINKVLFPIIES